MTNPCLEIPVVRFMKLHEKARLPEYAHGEEDAGMDLFFLGVVDLDNQNLLPLILFPESQRRILGTTCVASTGLAIELPPGHEGQVRSRSGLAAKHGVIVLNAPGTIDPGYRGELKVILQNTGNKAHNIMPGDKIAQLVIAPVTHAKIEEVADLSGSERGEGGFGSTGR